MHLVFYIGYGPDTVIIISDSESWIDAGFIGYFTSLMSHWNGIKNRSLYVSILSLLTIYRARRLMSRVFGYGI